MSFTHERELTYDAMKNSLVNNQIGDEGALFLASALKSPNCKLTDLQWVCTWRSEMNWSDAKQPLAKSNWRWRPKLNCGCTAESNLQCEFDLVSSSQSAFIWSTVSNSILMTSHITDGANSIDRAHEVLINAAIQNRKLLLKSCRARCMIALLAGATIERVGRKSTLFKMKIDMFRKLLTFLPIGKWHKCALSSLVVDQSLLFDPSISFLSAGWGEFVFNNHSKFDTSNNDSSSC